MTAHPESVGVTRSVVGAARALQERRVENPSWPQISYLQFMTCCTRVSRLPIISFGFRRLLPAMLTGAIHNAFSWPVQSY